MMSTNPDSDDDVVTELQQALAERESVPFQALQAARAAFDLRALDREFDLMALTDDSLLEDAVLARSGPGANVRALRFTGSDVYLEVEILNGSFIGQLIPPQQAYVSLETMGGSAAAEQTDELGTFLLDGPPVGPVRLTCRTAAGPLRTDWFNY